MGEKVENRGGAREGAGRKPLLDLSSEQRKTIIADVESVAAENGTTFGRELGKMMFGMDKDDRTKLAAMKLFSGDVLAKVSEREVTITEHVKPQVYLPEKYQDGPEAPIYKPSETAPYKPKH